MNIDELVGDSIYNVLAEEWIWTPAGGPPITVGGIPDEGMTTVREETRDGMLSFVFDNPDLELKVLRREVPADEIKDGDLFARNGVEYKVRSHNVLNTTELIIKLTSVP